MAYLDVELTREAKSFYTRLDAAAIAGYGDLTGRRIAVLRGARYFERFDADAALTRLEIGDYATGLRLVEKRRVDAVIMPELLGDYLISQR